MFKEIIIFIKVYLLCLTRDHATLLTKREVRFAAIKY